MILDELARFETLDSHFQMPSNESIAIDLYVNSFLNGYMGWLKKSFSWHFQHYQDHLQYEFLYSQNYRQSTISEQILKIFGECQNCQN